MIHGKQIKNNSADLSKINWENYNVSTDTVAGVSETKKPVNKEYVDGLSIEQSVTFSELETLITDSELISNKYYKITDFVTKHQIQTTSDINTGVAEELIVQAKSPSVLASQAFSLLHPTDIIFYDVSDNLCEDGTTPRTGKIIYREDPIKMLSTHYDWRNVKFARYLTTGFRHSQATKVDNDNFNVDLIDGGIPASDDNIYREYYIQFPNETHNANPNITLNKNGNSLTFPLKKLNGVELAANELQTFGTDRKALVHYSPKHKCYIVYDNAIENNQVQGYLAWNNAASWYIGNKRIEVDINDRSDLFTFGNQADGGALRDIHIDKWFSNDNNIIFLANNSNTRHVYIGTNSRTMTFVGNKHISKYFGTDNLNSVIGQGGWSNYHDEIWDCLYIGQHHYLMNHGFQQHNAILGNAAFYYLFFNSAATYTTLRLRAQGGVEAYITFQQRVRSCTINAFGFDNVKFGGSDILNISTELETQFSNASIDTYGSRVHLKDNYVNENFSQKRVSKEADYSDISGEVEIDFELRDTVKKTIIGDITNIKFINGEEGRTYTLHLKIDDTGGYEFDYIDKGVYTQDAIPLSIDNSKNARNLFSVLVLENDKYFVSPIYSIGPRVFNFDLIGSTEIITVTENEGTLTNEQSGDTETVTVTENAGTVTIV